MLMQGNRFTYFRFIRRLFNRSIAMRRFSAISSAEHLDVMVDVDDDPESRKENQYRLAEVIVYVWFAIRNATPTGHC